MNITRDIKKSFKPFFNSKPFKGNQTQKLNIIRLPQNQDYKHDSLTLSTTGIFLSYRLFLNDFEYSNIISETKTVLNDRLLKYSLSYFNFIDIFKYFKTISGRAPNLRISF